MFNNSFNPRTLAEGDLSDVGWDGKGRRDDASSSLLQRSGASQHTLPASDSLHHPIYLLLFICRKRKIRYPIRSKFVSIGGTGFKSKGFSSLEGTLGPPIWG